MSGRVSRKMQASRRRETRLSCLSFPGCGNGSAASPPDDRLRTQARNPSGRYANLGCLARGEAIAAALSYYVGSGLQRETPQVTRAILLQHCGAASHQAVGVIFVRKPPNGL